METVQQNGRFTFFESIPLLGIYSLYQQNKNTLNDIFLIINQIKVSWVPLRNGALPSLHRGSLEITHTVPLRR